MEKVEPIKSEMNKILTNKDTLERTYYNMTQSDDITWGNVA